MVLASASIVLATSVREYQAMTRDQQVIFLAKEMGDLLEKVKAYDPQLEQKTHYYMLEETNQYGVSVGMGAVLSVIDISERKHPETMDIIQVEATTKFIMEKFWKKQGIVVPDTVLNPKKNTSSTTTGTNAPSPAAQS